MYLKVKSMLSWCLRGFFEGEILPEINPSNTARCWQRSRVDESHLKNTRWAGTFAIALVYRWRSWWSMIVVDLYRSMIVHDSLEWFGLNRFLWTRSVWEFTRGMRNSDVLLEPDSPRLTEKAATCPLRKMNEIMRMQPRRHRRRQWQM